MSLVLPASEPLQVPLDDDVVVAADARVFYEALTPAVRHMVGLNIALSGNAAGLGKEFITPPTLNVAIAHIEALFEGLQGEVRVRPHYRLHFSSVVSRAFRLLDSMARYDRELFVDGATVDDIRPRMLGSPELYWLGIEALCRACRSHEGQPALAFERSAPLNTPCWAFGVARVLASVLKACGAGHSGEVLSRMLRGLRVIDDEHQGAGRQAVAAWKTAAHEWTGAATPAQHEAAAKWAAKEIPVLDTHRTFVVPGLGQFRLRMTPIARPEVPVEVAPVAKPVLVTGDAEAEALVDSLIPEGLLAPAATRRHRAPRGVVREGVVETVVKTTPARAPRREFTVAERQAHRERKRQKAERAGYDDVAGVLAENAVAAGHFARNANKGRY